MEAMVIMGKGKDTIMVTEEATEEEPPVLWRVRTASAITVNASTGSFTAGREKMDTEVIKGECRCGEKREETFRLLLLILLLICQNQIVIVINPRAGRPGLVRFFNFLYS